MYDIVTIGSGTQDVFLTGRAFKAVCEFHEECVEEFELGAKIEVENVVHSTGGGATNAAVMFAQQGLKTAFLGKVADDIAGQEVLKDLRVAGVNTDMVATDNEFGTDYSTLLLSPNGERTILVYRGASHNIKPDDFNLKNIETKWLYITSLAGNFDLLERLLDWASQNEIKVAIDPGSKELEQTDKLQPLLSKISLIKGNKEEMGNLAETDTPEDIVRQLVKEVEWVIVTDGPEGSYASDGKQLLKGGIYEDVPVIDRTGAGDAFGSGFVTAILQGRSLKEAFILGSANSTSVVQKIGAKAGILPSGSKLHDMSLQEFSL